MQDMKETRQGLPDSYFGWQEKENKVDLTI